MKKKAEKKSIVTITKGSRGEAKKVLRQGLNLLGGANAIVKKGSVVLLKPNLGYPHVEGLPPYTSTTDHVVLAGLTELFLEAGAKKVIAADGPVHGITSEYMFKETGVKDAVEKAGGEVRFWEKEDYVLRKVPGGVILKEQWVPKICLEVDLIVNVPKIKTHRVGKFTLGYKNMFGCVPEDERTPWHRMPEHFYLLVDLYKLLPYKFTVMDGFVIQEGLGPRLGTPVDWGCIVMGQDPVATEAVTVLAMGHEPYEQSVLSIAAKAGQGTMDISQIEVRGEKIETVRRYCKMAPEDVYVHPDPNVVEYCGGMCGGCARWIPYTPFPREMKPGKKYSLVVGVTPRLPDKFGEDEVIVLGNCAVRSKAEIETACEHKGIKPIYMPGCPPTLHRKAELLKAHKMDHLPYSHKISRITE